MKKIILLLGLCLGFLSPVLSLAAEDGGYAGAFLQMAIQARPGAMGGAYIGVSDDAAGQFYNPAGITVIPKRTFTSSYRVMTLDRKLSLVSLALPTKLESAVGISWIYAGYGDVAMRNTSGQDLGTSIGSSEHDFGVAFAKHFIPAFSAGTKLNYYHKSLGTIRANSVGINLGMMFMVDSMLPFGYMEKKPITDIKLGLVLDHVSAKYPWSNTSGGLSATQSDKFPITIGAGVSCRSFKRQLLLAADLEKNTEQTAKFRFGGEYNLKNSLLLRAGLNDGVITAGMGYKFDLKSFALQFDYAFLPDRVDEGSDHLFGFSLLF